MMQMIIMMRMMTAQALGLWRLIRIGHQGAVPCLQVEISHSYLQTGGNAESLTVLNEIGQGGSEITSEEGMCICMGSF